MAERKLFLMSGALTPKLTESFLKLIGEDPHNLKAIFIPTAADPEEGDKGWVNEARQSLANLGFLVSDLDLKEYTPDTIRSALTGRKVVYVNGGNTYYLLYWMRKSGFDKAMKELLNEGTVYLGTSAGSIVVGPDISLSGWEPDGDINGVKLDDLTGLNFVDFTISPHFQQDSLEKLKRRKEHFPYRVYALTDEQAIKVIDNNHELIGDGEKIILK